MIFSPNFLFSFFVILAYQAQNQTFTFPDIFPEKDRNAAEGSMEEMQEKFMEDEKQRQKPDPRRGGVTEWFGLWRGLLTANSVYVWIHWNLMDLLALKELWCHIVFLFCFLFFFKKRNKIKVSMCERVLVWLQSRKFRPAPDYRRRRVVGLQPTVQNLHHLKWPPFHRPPSLLPPWHGSPCVSSLGSLSVVLPRFPLIRLPRRFPAFARPLVARWGIPRRPDLGPAGSDHQEQPALQSISI